MIRSFRLNRVRRQLDANCGEIMRSLANDPDPDVREHLWEQRARLSRRYEELGGQLGGGLL